MAFPTGIEPVTYALEERCSIQLSYGNMYKNGIEGGTRTLTPSLATDFKSVVSAIPPLRH